MKNSTNPPEAAEDKLDTVVSLLTKMLLTMEKTSTEDVQYYDNADLKKLLNVSDSTLHRIRKEKAIPFRKIRGKIFYPKSFFNKAFKL